MVTRIEDRITQDEFHLFKYLTTSLSYIFTSVGNVQKQEVRIKIVILIFLSLTFYSVLFQSILIPQGQFISLTTPPPLQKYSFWTHTNCTLKMLVIESSSTSPSSGASPLEFPMSLQGVSMGIFWIQWTPYGWNGFLPPQTT